MTVLAILMLAATLQAPPTDPAELGDEGRELFRIEREADARRAEPASDSPQRASPGGPEAPANAFDTATADALRNDAWLHDVCFVDATRGWAVGDRGTIWHTGDGGRNWQLQESGVACTLWSVSFLDAATGWAAGGFSHPYLHTSSGVVLATRDGGRHWYRDRGGLLPDLKRIGFFDAKRGWAAGNSSPLFPGGVFSSRDGGRSWTAACGGGTAGWTSGDFFDPHTGILAGRNATHWPPSAKATSSRAGPPPSTSKPCGNCDSPPRPMPGWSATAGGAVDVRLGRSLAGAAVGLSPRPGRDDGLRGLGRPRPAVLDGRLAGQPRAALARRRPHLERLSHSHPPAALPP